MEAKFHYVGIFIMLMTIRKLVMDSSNHVLYLMLQYFTQCINPRIVIASSTLLFTRALR
jgi:hypothetical protein